MWPYIIFYVFLSGIALQSAPNFISGHHWKKGRKFGPGLLTVLVLTLFIGLRYRVGGDWYAYERVLEQARYLTFSEAAFHGDPAYWLINYFVGVMGGNILWVNLIAGLIFAAGLTYFCRNLPRPWLALSIAFPYLIVVVAMGYARQGVALSLLMVGLVHLQREKFSRYIFWVICATMFHKTAIIMIAVGAATVNKKRWIWIPITLLAALGGYAAFLEDSTDRLIAGYITARYESTGALIRLTMNMLAAAPFFLMRSSFFVSELSKRLWIVFSVSSAALFLFFFTGFPSTALDRIALYLLPLQLFVFSNLPDVLGKYGRHNHNIVALILIYYALILLTWLNFANNAFAWLPYQVWLGG